MNYDISQALSHSLLPLYVWNQDPNINLDYRPYITPQLLCFSFHERMGRLQQEAMCITMKSINQAVYYLFRLVN